MINKMLVKKEKNALMHYYMYLAHHQDINSHEGAVLPLLEGLEGEVASGCMEEGCAHTPQVHFGGKLALGIGVDEGTLVHAWIQVLLSAVKRDEGLTWG